MIYLDVQSRPLRCCFIVQSTNQLNDAVTLFTHMWGGSCNHIFPSPRNNHEAELLQEIIRNSAPDIIFVAGLKPVPDLLHKVLQNTTAYSLHLGTDATKNIRYFAERERPLYIQDFLTPHILDVLTPTSRDYRHTIVEPRRLEPTISISATKPDTTTHGLFLQAGIPSKAYLHFLSTTGEHTLVQEPQSYSEILEQSIILASGSQVRGLTLTATRSWPEYDPFLMTKSDIILSLYLYRKGDLHTLSTYWNQSTFYGENHLPLPYSLFMENLEQSLQAIIQARPAFKLLRIITKVTKGVAATLKQKIADAFQDAGRGITVEVYYDSAVYAANWWELESGVGQLIKQEQSPDEYILVNPNPPVFFEGTSFMFGLTIDASTDENRKFSLPDTVVSSYILTSGIGPLRGNTSDNMEVYRIMGKVFRSTCRGITTTTADRYKDGSRVIRRLYIPPEDVITRTYFQHLGYDLRENEASLYARTVRRVVDLQGRLSNNSDHLNVASCLIDMETYKPVDRTLAAMKGQIQKIPNVNHAEVSKALPAILARLLRSGMVRRGYAVTCEHCRYSGWYPLESVGEMVTCSGCGYVNLLPLEPEIKFRLSEVLHGFFSKGGRAVIDTLSALSDMGIPGIYAIGGEIVPITGGNCIADADIIILSDYESAIVECKAWKSLKQNRKRFEASLDHLIYLATMLRFQTAYISAYMQDTTGVINLVQKFVHRAKARGISLRLLLNGELVE